MANRVHAFGMDVAINRKLNSRYNLEAEKEVLHWIQQLTGESISSGRENVHHALKSGQILMKLISTIYDRSPNLPAGARHVPRPIRFNTMSTPFKHMENIELFLNLCEAYGVARTSLFQTVDLYESRNMAQVLNTILMLGTEAQRNGMQGPVCGPRPCQENRRHFSENVLRSGENVIGLQAGTNKLASQKGMTFGGVRHIADIRCDDCVPESQAIIGLQMGTNKCASQKGMTMGGVRHIADIRCDEVSKEGQAVIGLQMGTNQCASQKGMRMGASRHVADIRVEAACQEGQSIINLQYGSNQGANQSGMRIGVQRHIADIRCESTNPEAASSVSLQMGFGQNQAASQSGMSFGAQRHIVDSY